MQVLHLMTMADYRAYGYSVFSRLFRFIGLCEINEREEDKGTRLGTEGDQDRGARHDVLF